MRWPLFHHAIANPVGAGRSPAPPAWCLRAGNGGNGGDLAHELGHNVDLRHGCRVSAIEQNSKPHYKSIMNYAFDTFGDTYPSFSLGELESVAPAATTSPD